MHLQLHSYCQLAIVASGLGTMQFCKCAGARGIFTLKKGPKVQKGSKGMKSLDTNFKLKLLDNYRVKHLQPVTNNILIEIDHFLHHSMLLLLIDDYRVHGINNWWWSLQNL